MSRLGALPANLRSIGLGSNRSTWLGPPFWNIWMTAFALASKCGRRGFRSYVFRAPKRSRVSSEARAAPCRPPLMREKKSRREGLVDIGEIRGNQHGVAEIGEGGPARGLPARRLALFVLQVLGPLALQGIGVAQRGL